MESNNTILSKTLTVIVADEAKDLYPTSLLVALLYAVRSGFVPRVSNADEGDFLLVDASDRELDGAPALALTFTLPLDARKSYDKSIRVFEMPSPPARPAESRRFFEEDAA